MNLQDLRPHLLVPWVPQLEIIDSTKIRAFQTCPRGYFYEYVLGFRQPGGNVHLMYGTAWHEGMRVMKHLLNEHGYSGDVVNHAYEYFLQSWNKEIQVAGFDPNDPKKNPVKALSGLIEYAKQWKHDKERYEVLYTEVAGSAPYNERGDVFYFKMDAIMQDLRTGLIINMDHKTGGGFYPSRKAWFDQWHNLHQISNYIHALACLVGVGNIGGLIVNASMFYKNNVEHLRVPITKRPDQLLQSMWEVHHYMEQLRWNYEQLAECKESDQIMFAFPRNPGGCSKWGCKFPGICSMWCNPLQKLDRIPSDLVIEHWDPRQDHDEADFTVHIDNFVDYADQTTSPEKGRTSASQAVKPNDKKGGAASSGRSTAEVRSGTPTVQDASNLEFL